MLLNAITLIWFSEKLGAVNLLVTAFQLSFF